MSYRGVKPLSTTTVKYRPVQFESAGSLCGCLTNDGSGFLSWTNSGQIHFATHAASSDWIEDNTVTSADGSFTVSGTTIRHQSNWLGNDGHVYILVMSDTSSWLYQELFKSDVGSAPTSFSLHATLQNIAKGSGFWPVSMEFTCGIPYVDGDTWVLPVAFFLESLGYIYPRAAILRSTNGGVSWSRRYTVGYHSGSRYLEFLSPHVAVDTTTGYMYWMTGSTTAGSGSDTSEWHRSTDGGASWTSIQNVGPGNYHTPYTGRDGALYVLRTNDYTTRRLADPDDMQTQTTTATHLSFSMLYHRVCLGNGSLLYLFSGDTVQGNLATGGWRILHHILT